MPWRVTVFNYTVIEIAYIINCLLMRLKIKLKERSKGELSYLPCFFSDKDIRHMPKHKRIRHFMKDYHGLLRIITDMCLSTVI